MANRTYEYNPINDSPVIVATAGEALKTAAAVVLTKDFLKLERKQQELWSLKMRQ